MTIHNPVPGNAPALPIARRSILAGMVSMAALPAAALPAAVSEPLSVHEKIKALGNQILMEFATDVPPGTVVTNVMLIADSADYGTGHHFVHVTAKRPEWTGRDDPFYCFGSRRGVWEFHDGKKGEGVRGHLFGGTGEGEFGR